MGMEVIRHAMDKAGRLTVPSSVIGQEQLSKHRRGPHQTPNADRSTWHVLFLGSDFQMSAIHTSSCVLSRIFEAILHCEPRRHGCQHRKQELSDYPVLQGRRWCGLDKAKNCNRDDQCDHQC